jgi:hypothetical protein
MERTEKMGGEGSSLDRFLLYTVVGVTDPYCYNVMMYVHYGKVD